MGTLWIMGALVLWGTQQVLASVCPRGSFQAPGMSECALCPPGTYQLATNATSCIPCEPGRYLPFSGAQSPHACLGCPDGFYSTAGSSSCTQCPQGTFSRPFSFGCVSCPKGTTIASRWDPNEAPCEVCDRGYTDEENMFQCKSCPLDSVAPPGSTSVDQCVPCPAGTGSGGFDQCQPCAKGLFDAGPSSGCQPCPGGSTSEKDFGSTKCIPCKPGQYGRLTRPFGHSSKCFDCPPNTTSYAPGARFCRRINGPCPRSYIQTSAGDCERCNTDERYDLKKEKCVPCPRSEGSVGGLPLKCAPCSEVLAAGVVNSHCFPSKYRGLQRTPMARKICAPGTYMEDTEFARFCVLCDPGFFSPKANSKECVRCPKGSVSTEYGARRCARCPEGMMPDRSSSQCVFQKTGCTAGTRLVMLPGTDGYCARDDCFVSGDSLSCKPCTGSFYDTYSFKGCEPCPGSQVRDTYFKCGCHGVLADNHGIINRTCSQCPAGSYGERIAQEVENRCVKCPAGTYRVVKGFEVMQGRPAPCMKCAVGFVTRQDGATQCEKCPSGTFSYGIGDAQCLPFGVPSAPVRFNDPLDLGVKRFLERFPW